MARVRLNISGGMVSRIDPSGLPQGKSSLVVNTFCDPYGTNVGRPGLTTWPEESLSVVNLNFGSGAVASPRPVGTIGLFGWKGYLVHALASRQVYVYDQDGNARCISTTFALPGTERATFLEDDDGRLVICAGGEPAVWEAGAATLLAPLGVANAMPLASHAAICGRRLCLNNANDDRVFYSTPTDHSAFDISGNPNVIEAGWFTAESRADPILAMVGKWNLLYLLGSYSIDTYMVVDDPDGPFSLAWSSPRGTGASRSAVFADNRLFFLGEDRKFYVLAEGSIPTPISYDIEDIVLGLGTVSDCVGQHVEIGGGHFIAWTFPTSKTTLIYDYALSAVKNEAHWYTWRTWDSTTKWDAMPLENYAYVPEWNRHFCGRGTDQAVYEMSMSVHTDANGPGGPIRRIRRLAPIDHGTFEAKFATVLRASMKRGQAAVGVTPTQQVRMRDDGRLWSRRPRDMELGEQGDLRYLLTLRHLGKYRLREIELECQANAEYKMAALEEEFSMASEDS